MLRALDSGMGRSILHLKNDLGVNMGRHGDDDKADEKDSQDGGKHEKDKDKDE